MISLTYKPFEPPHEIGHLELYSCPINAPLLTRLTENACRLNRLRYEHAERIGNELGKLFVRACGSCPGCVALARR